MRIYLAARYSRREELLGYKADLEAAGHVVTSRWLAGAHQWDPVVEQIESPEAAIDSIPLEAVRFAREDVEDVEAADLLIAFTERPRANLASRGGRHVELGMAIALDKAIFVIGPRENVFCTLPGIEVYADWRALLDDWPVAASLRLRTVTA